MNKIKSKEKKGFLKEDSTLFKLKKLFQDERFRFALGIIILLFTVYLFLAFSSFFFAGAADQSDIETTTEDRIVKNWTGPKGALLAFFFISKWLGLASFFVLAFMLIVSLRLMNAHQYKIRKWFIILFSATIWTSIAFSFFFDPFSKNLFFHLGGDQGSLICEIIKNNIGWPGTFLLLVGTLCLFCIFTFQSTTTFLRSLFFKKDWTTKDNSLDTKEIKEEQDEDESQEEPEPEKIELDKDFYEEEQPIRNKKVEEEENTFDSETDMKESSTISSSSEDNFTIEVAKEEEAYKGDTLGKYDPTLDLSHYKYPTSDLLKKNEVVKPIDIEEQRNNKQRIIETLDNYGIKISRIEATVGPTITLYEIIPAPGVRISKIKNLENDIALSLSALGIRIIAPIPGKGTIGIEVPNKDPQTVSLQPIIFSKKFQESTYELPIALGKTITNDIFMVDLCKMPHILVAGATGQGKSVGLNVIITSLLYKKHPSQLKFVLIDPKKVEFNIYSNIERHFLAKLPDAEEAIITDVSKVVQTLNSLTKEMDMRYNLLNKAHVRQVKEYNEKFINRQLNPEKGHRFMPYIVVVIDEFGDLIMTAGKDIELPIARIAQLARAVGIHMIIATQRPSTNIITGTIKANFPARLAFRVSSMIDSRTILDTPGANQLIGRGDLLFSQGSDQTRVQCAFVDTPEVENIAEFIGQQPGYPTAFLLPECDCEENKESNNVNILADKDPLFEEAARLLVIHQQGSTSLIQRKFSIGYNRAGRIVDQLEAAGIIGPFEGSKARQVLIQDETELELILAKYR